MNAMDDDLDPTEMEELRICASCVGEEFLRAEIEQEGEKVECSYCEKVGKAISMGELADRIEGVFEEHFYRTASEPSGFEYSILKEGGSWDRKGEPVTDVIGYTARIDEFPATHVQRILEHRHDDFEAAQMGEENPFEAEAHYADKGPVDAELRAEWAYFQQSLMTEARLFNRTAEAILESIFEDLEHHKTHEGKPVIVDAGPGTALTALYRARVFHEDEKLESALMRPDIQIGPPPFKLAMAGRMNARGISVFYGADDPDVALAEVRPPVGSRVAVGRFELIRPLRLLDVEALRSIYVTGSRFDGKFIRQLEKAKFLERVSDRVTMPVMPDDEPFEYLVTQAIADYLANRAQPQVDGIIYASVQAGADGVNVALFHKAARVETLDLPEGTKIGARLWDTGEDGPAPDYWVWEQTPPPTETEKEADDEFPHVFDPFPAASKSDPDTRKPALRFDPKAMSVHHVMSVSFKSAKFTVHRHRTEKTDPKF